MLSTTSKASISLPRDSAVASFVPSACSRDSGNFEVRTSGAGLRGLRSEHLKRKRCQAQLALLCPRGRSSLYRILGSRALPTGIREKPRVSRGSAFGALGCSKMSKPQFRKTSTAITVATAAVAAIAVPAFLACTKAPPETLDQIRMRPCPISFNKQSIVSLNFALSLSVAQVAPFPRP